jgi:hypothetical protein
MARQLEHAPGEVAPEAGTYEQLNVFGRPTGIRVILIRAHPFPKAPHGHSWTLVAEDHLGKC